MVKCLEKNSQKVKAKDPFVKDFQMSNRLIQRVQCAAVFAFN